jgi:membrane-associated protein
LGIIEFVLHLNTNLALFVSHHGVWIYALLFVVIFCQTGIVVMAILPGDSLLFAAGSVAALGAMNVYFLIPLLMIAAIAGNTVNYFMGDSFGHWILKLKDSIFFKKAYVDKTHAFFEKHGSKAIILALFVPIVRTFTPFLAGFGEMRLAKFMFCNVVGVTIWIGLIVGCSYFFGNIPAVKNHFSTVIIAIIFVSVLPGFISIIKRKCNCS